PRIAAFNPGQSPPAVRMPTRFTRFMVDDIVSRLRGSRYDESPRGNGRSPGPSFGESEGAAGRGRVDDGRELAPDDARRRPGDGGHAHLFQNHGEQRDDRP